MTPGESGTFYRAGYEEVPAGPQAFDPQYRDYCGCSFCQEAREKYESWRLSQISPSEALNELSYPQALEVVTNALEALGSPGTRGFSYEGEWRGKEFLREALKVIVKGDSNG